MLLLNVCCAPCGLPVIEHLLSGENPFVLYFYGSNLYPEDEYKKRAEETQKIAALYGLRFYRRDYRHAQWRQFVERELPQPPEKYAENGDRCLACFRYRIDGTVLFAKENNFDAFATTLSISRFKDTIFINNYAKLLADKNGLEYVQFPLDARSAHKAGLALSRKHNIYRQKYCGCEFSLPAA